MKEDFYCSVVATLRDQPDGFRMKQWDFIPLKKQKQKTQNNDSL